MSSWFVVSSSVPWFACFLYSGWNVVISQAGDVCIFSGDECCGYLPL